MHFHQLTNRDKTMDQALVKKLIMKMGRHLPITEASNCPLKIQAAEGLTAKAASAVITIVKPRVNNRPNCSPS